MKSITIPLPCNPALGLCLGFSAIAVIVFVIFSSFPYANPNHHALDFLLVFLTFGFMGALLTPLFDRDITIVSLSLAFVLSYAVYSCLALSLKMLGLGFEVFETLWLVLLAIAAWHARGYGRGSKLHLSSLFVCALALVLTATYFAYPSNFDQSYFQPSYYYGVLHRDFSSSNLDVVPFGITEAQPRFQANVYHALFALFSTLTGIDPFLLALHIASPYIGFFLLIAMPALVWELFNRRMNVLIPFLATLSCVLFISVWDDHFFVYWHHFNLLNSPTLDKNFCQFLLLPVVSLVFFNAVTSTQKRWCILFLGLLPAVAASHPLAPLYLLLMIGLIFVSLLTDLRAHKTTGLVGIALTLILVAGVAAPSEIQIYFNHILAFDAAHYAERHYWSGQYAGPQNSVQYFQGTLFPFIRKEIYFQDAIIVFSAFCFALWSLHLRQRKELRGYAMAGFLSSLCLILLAVVGPQSLSLPGYVAMVAILGVVSWRMLFMEATMLYAFAYRLQFFNQAGLVLLHAAVSVALYFKPEMFRGLERLHWFYFGYFSIVWIGCYLLFLMQSALRLCVAWSRKTTSYVVLLGASVASAAMIVFGFLVSVEAVQIKPLYANGPISFTPYVNRGEYFMRITGSKNIIHKAYERRDVRPRLQMPPWMLADDRFLYLDSTKVDYFDFYLLKTSAWYSAAYTDAYALQKLGPSFMEQLTSYWDVKDGKISCATMQFLLKQRVSILITDQQEYVASLKRQDLFNIESIEPDVYRLAAPNHAKIKTLCAH